MKNDDTYRRPCWKIKFCTEIILCILFLLTNIAATEATIMHVNPGGNDANSGLSWAQAKKTVTAAMNSANTSDEIWVAAGTYAEHIQMKNGVALYGGFKGNETNRDQRDWDINITILDGTKSGTVVTISIIAGNMPRQDTIIDGFTITGGKEVPSDPLNPGGGISILSAAPVIANNIVALNHSRGIGGGILISGYKVDTNSHAVITNNKILANSAAGGGGIAIVNSSPTIFWNAIAWNEAGGKGGGIGCWEDSSPLISNNLFLYNLAGIEDGGGGIFATSRKVDGRPCDTMFCKSAPSIINNMIAANGGFPGGGISTVDSNRGIASIANNTIASNNGAGIYWLETLPLVSTTAPKVINNIVAFNTWGLHQGALNDEPAVVRSNCVYGNALQDKNTNYHDGMPDMTGIEGNISADPRMANYKIGRFHIQPDSPCINAGTLDVIGTGWIDFDGQDRVQGAGVDIGADESDTTTWDSSVPVLHVRIDGDDANDGSSWAAAKKTVEAAIYASAMSGGEIWVAEGTYAEHITIPAFVYLLGGFAGNETEAAGRNVAAHPSILDGSRTPPVVQSRNAGYLVSSLDGFVVQNGGGFTGGAWIDPGQGVAGMGAGISISMSSPYIRNNTIRWNSLGNPHTYLSPGSEGAGIGFFSAYPVISHNTITENESLCDFGRGGALYCEISMPTIEWNTITGNHAKNGAAVYCLDSTLLLRKNIIDDNSMYVNYLYSESDEAAVTVEKAEDFVIEGNTIKANRANSGGGIYLKTSPVGLVMNNLILNNTARSTGGGICLIAQQREKGELLIANNTIANNLTGQFPYDSGGGMSINFAPIFPSPPTPPEGKLIIANNILAFNTSGIFQPPDTYPPLIPPILLNNDFFNTGPEYFTLDLFGFPKELPLDPTNILVDPDFVNKDVGDFHLLSSSPCIDTGNNEYSATLETDFDGNSRITDRDDNGTAIVDMGAFELPSIQAGILGDINNDAVVDISDVILDLRIALKLDSVKPCSDINKDGLVDISDVILTLRMALGLDELKQCTG